MKISQEWGMLRPKTHVEKRKQPLEPQPRVEPRTSLFSLSQVTSSDNTQAEREEVFPMLGPLLINFFFFF